MPPSNTPNNQKQATRSQPSRAPSKIPTKQKQDPQNHPTNPQHQPTSPQAHQKNSANTNTQPQKKAGRNREKPEITKKPKSTPHPPNPPQHKHPRHIHPQTLPAKHPIYSQNTPKKDPISTPQQPHKPARYARKPARQTLDKGRSLTTQKPTGRGTGGADGVPRTGKNARGRGKANLTIESPANRPSESALKATGEHYRKQWRE